MKDLPTDRDLFGYLSQAATFIDSGQGETMIAVSRRVVKAPKAAVETPKECTAASKKNKPASKVC